MSGFSDGVQCPNCNEDAEKYTDWKPFDYIRISCLNCGLVIFPKAEYLSLKQLNKERKDNNLEPLKKKPIQNKDL